MLPILLTQALAADIAFSGGVGVGAGTGEDRSWITSGPAVAVNVDSQPGPFDVWYGVSATALLAWNGVCTITAAPFQIEGGFGLGTRTVAVGALAGIGSTGGTAGGYARVSVPTRCDRRVGVELRVARYPHLHDGVAMLLYRIQPGSGDGCAPEPVYEAPDATYAPAPY
jgi:hypothetical protein